MACCAAVVDDADDSRARLPFEPALEGLRGLCIAGVLCFHAEFSWAVGGFLPIATFFTLSGYLITSLFLVEWERTGALRIGRFWARRFRRLMPASLLALAGMSVFGAFVATPDQLGRLRGDVFWALAYAANWRFMLSDTSYAQLFVSPSPLLHFWSLAIEEQFYLVFPLLAAGGLWLGSGSRTVLAGIFGALTVGSVATAVALGTTGASVDRIYFGTDTRGAELLMGALLALALCGRSLSNRNLRRAIAHVGAVAMIVMIGFWAFVDLNDHWLYTGGLAGYSLLSLGVVAASLQPTGAVRWLLSLALLRWIGRISYGAYVYHWPLYLWLTPERTGLGQWPLFALRVAVTLALASLSYELFESPIRRGRRLTGWRPLVVTPAAFAIIAVGADAVSVPSPGALDFAATKERLERQLADSDPQGLAVGPPPGLDRASPRIAVYGDSTALTLALALGGWARTHEAGQPSRGVTELGCGLLQDGVSRLRNRPTKPPARCREMREMWKQSIGSNRPDLAVVLFGLWEVCDRKLPGDGSWRHLGDPVFDAYVLDEMLAAVDVLSAEGTLVVWLTHPPVRVRKRGTHTLPETPYPESDPRRMERLNELIFELEARRPETIRVVDLAAYLHGLPLGEFDPAYRPDGVHLSVDASRRVVDDWLAHELLRVYHEAGEARRVGASSKRIPSSPTTTSRE